MKELVKSGGAKLKALVHPKKQGIIVHIVAAVLGFIVCRGKILGDLSPFGVAFAAGCNIYLLPSVSVGVFLGYLIPGILGGFRYIAALFAVLAIRVMLSGYKKLSANPYFLGAVALLSGLFTSVLALLRLEKYALGSFAEAIIMFFCAFFLCRASTAFFRLKTGLTGEESASLLIIISIMLTALSSLTFYEVSIGRILGLVLILVSAKYGGTLSGAVSGIAVSFSQSAAGLYSGFVLFSFGGMLAGFFAYLGRYAQIVVVGICGILSLWVGENAPPFAVILVEYLFASAAFLAMPSKAGVFFGKLFSGCPRVGASMGVKKGIVMRLNKASSALNDVSETVEEVSNALSKIKSPSFSQVSTLVEKDTCSGCVMRISCWEAHRAETLNALVDITKAVRSKKPNPESAADEDFKIKCLRLEKLGQSVTERYNAYARSMAAESRMEEVRGVVTDQFGGIADMLSLMSREFERDDTFDNGAALNGAAALKNLDIRPKEASAKIDRFGRMTLEFKVQKREDTVFNKLQIMRMLSICLERDFDVPSLQETGGEVFITVTERPKFTVEIGISQLSAEEGAMCGDAYRTFYDGSGRYFMILCDGMGTGGRAAVDSTFVSELMAKLLKAGFSYNCALKILNSSMLFKSTDESMSTLDITCIDLFNGKTELLKAGAAPTLVRRGGKSGKAQSSSLPVGILREVSFDRADLKLKEKDIVLMLSDGVLTDDTDWIRKVLEEHKEGSAQNLAETVAEGAKRRCKSDKNDDITVMAAIINRKI